MISQYQGADKATRGEAIDREFLGELYTEMARYDEALEQLLEAKEVADEVVPDSDVTTEIERRLADLYTRTERLDEAWTAAMRCVRVCLKIHDYYELGAVMRIIAEIHAKRGELRKAEAAYEWGVLKLRGIHECYELMKTGLSYASYLIDRGREEAETYVLEARQLARKLDLAYFQGWALALLARYKTRAGVIEEARDRLLEAKEICEGLQACDRRQLGPVVEEVERELQGRILEESVAGAEELKTICRVYEEARFPLREVTPDVAYQVARTVGAERLFLARRVGRGYGIALAYNISVGEAKELVRRLDRGGSRRLLGVGSDPAVLTAHTGERVVCVPGRDGSERVLCTCFGAEVGVEPKHLEYLLASVEALERMVESEGGEKRRRGVAEGFVMGEDGTVHPLGSFKDILTATPEMIRLIRLAQRASESEETILLEGETGVGKELFAHAIHTHSGRAGRRFVAINAGGMPVSLLESQLFGHVKGAFTDAVSEREGLVEEAEGGTLFLDEVGEMNGELQVKLLRLLESGEYRRLGENRTRRANVRVVSATNRDLKAEVERGAFRRDLYYRLGTVKLRVPALRYRPRDIALLVRCFLEECAVRNGQRRGGRRYEIDGRAMEALEVYDWPGNVRELQNEIRRVVSLMGPEEETIRFEMLTEGIREYVKRKNRGVGELERTVERYERRLILHALSRHDWNRVRTAEELGIPRTTLLAKMRRLGVGAR